MCWNIIKASTQQCIGHFCATVYLNLMWFAESMGKKSEHNEIIATSFIPPLTPTGLVHKACTFNAVQCLYTCCVMGFSSVYESSLTVFPILALHTVMIKFHRLARLMQFCLSNAIDMFPKQSFFLFDSQSFTISYI